MGTLEQEKARRELLKIRKLLVKDRQAWIQLHASNNDS
jgi:hypothetical protein